jgi:hypothetical protein
LTLPNWVAATKDDRLEKPGPTERWHGYLTKVRHVLGEDCYTCVYIYSSSPLFPKKRKLDTRGQQERPTRRLSSQPSRRFARNAEVAEVFRKLSNLHQSCPLLPVDNWKAYSFRVVAGRVLNLNFEVSDDPETLERLRNVTGIGSSSFVKIKEYLRTGSLSRIVEFQTDPRRIAMKNMMDIWGVGRVKVRQQTSVVILLPGGEKSYAIT